MRQTQVKKVITQEQLQQFWNHSINPITGFKLNVSDRYTLGERSELKFVREMKQKFNKE
jgi:hypothetical protein